MSPRPCANGRPGPALRVITQRRLRNSERRPTVLFGPRMRGISSSAVTRIAPALALLALATVVAPRPSRAQVGPTQCDAATPPAVHFWRLPPRVRWGREYVFGFAGDDLAVSGPIHITMASPAGSKPFFRGKLPDDLSGRLFIELDRGDAPALVTATYPEEDINGSVCSRTLTSRVQGSTRAAVQHSFFYTNCRSPRYRPTHLIIACGDGNLYVTGIRWRHWNAAQAFGRGVGHFNDCTPYCAVGHFHTQAIMVRVYRPVYCTDVDEWQYSRLAYSFVGPSALRGDRGIRFPCGAI
jgi:hypothetical protein